MSDESIATSIGDLLRQRRALRRAGADAEGAAARDADTVEGYLQ